MHKSQAAGALMVVVGFVVLVLLADFLVSVILVILELVAVVIAILLVLGGIALIVGGRWWRRARWEWGGQGSKACMPRIV